MKNVSETAGTVFKAVGLAMGVATTALLVLDKIKTPSALILLSIGVAALGLSLFIDKKM